MRSSIIVTIFLTCGFVDTVAAQDIELLLNNASSYTPSVQRQYAEETRNMEMLDLTLDAFSHQRGTYDYSDAIGSVTGLNQYKQEISEQGDRRARANIFAEQTARQNAREQRQLQEWAEEQQRQLRLHQYRTNQYYQQQMSRVPRGNGGGSYQGLQ